MHHSAMRAISVLPFCAILSACAPNSPNVEPAAVRLPSEIRTIYEYPTIPAEGLSCLHEPAVPKAKTDIDLALWAQAVREAGADCRTKLEAIRNLVATWGSDG